MTLNKEEQSIVEEAAKELRRRESIALKKHPFDCRITLFDADQLSLVLKSYHIKHAILERENGQRVAIGNEPHKDFFTIKPYQIIELMFASRDHIEAYLSTAEVFDKSKMLSLTAPGLDEMRSYCTAINESILDVAVGLRGKGVKRVFEKLYSALGGEIPGKQDLLVSRIKYCREISNLYFLDKAVWKREMQELGLIR